MENAQARDLTRFDRVDTSLNVRLRQKSHPIHSRKYALGTRLEMYLRDHTELDQAFGHFSFYH